MVAELSKQFPKLKFVAGEQFIWSPLKRTIYYDEAQSTTPQGFLALLHEVGHALLGHKDYTFDLDLLNMEVEAWAKARELAQDFKLDVNEDHIENCLDTYRMWLFKRSRCPTCAQTSLQADARTYRCFICHSQWKVAPTRSLQPRRMNCIQIKYEAV